MQSTTYAGRRQPARWWTWFAVVALAASAVCVIVNLAVSGGITWALYPMGSLALALGVLAPGALMRRHRLLGMLVALTALIMPYLMLLDRLSPAPGWVWPMGFPIACIGLALLWLSLVLYGYTRISRWRVTGIVLLASLPASWGINHLADRFSGATPTVNWVNLIVIPLLALMCFAVARLFSKK